MREVEDGIAVFVHLMEHVVTEQLEQIAVARFRPGRIHVESGKKKRIRERKKETRPSNKRQKITLVVLWALVDKAKLADEAHKPTVLELFRHLILQNVIVTAQSVEL